MSKKASNAIKNDNFLKQSKGTYTFPLFNRRI